MNLVLPKCNQLFCLVGFLSLLAFPSSAQTSAERTNSVKKQAVQAFKAKEYSRAADLFQELYVQTSNGNLLYNVGLCQQRAGPRGAEKLKPLRGSGSATPRRRAARLLSRRA